MGYISLVPLVQVTGSLMIELPGENYDHQTNCYLLISHAADIVIIGNWFSFLDNDIKNVIT